ncbi:MAG: hypothetical protein ACLQFR_12260, partial [Streptosporangiaceae bacterium]
WHYPAGHPGSALPTTLPCGARTFLGTPVRRAAAARLTRPPLHQDYGNQPVKAHYEAGGAGMISQPPPAPR